MKHLSVGDVNSGVDGGCDDALGLLQEHLLPNSCRRKGDRSYCSYLANPHHIFGHSL